MAHKPPTGTTFPLVTPIAATSESIEILRIAIFGGANDGPETAAVLFSAAFSAGSALLHQDGVRRVEVEK
jgi:hypothetical protein